MRTFVAALALVLAVPAAAQGTRSGLAQRLDSISRAWLAAGPSAGVTVAVVRGRDTLLMEGLGLRDRERALPATAATVYRVGSITKQFTAAAVLQLVEARRIGLGDPITKYLPQYPQWSAVTVRQLLDHTSGIPSYTASPAWARTWNSDLTPAQLVDFVARDTVDFAPGTRWNYDNTGYVLLGMILDRVTGTPYPQYVRQHFFVPLGMRSAAYCPSTPVAADDAKGYDRTDGDVRPTTYLSMTHPYSAGALCMNVPDYLRWQTALTSGRVVSPASYAMMSRSDTLNDGSATKYGFGLAPAMLGTHRLIMHGGAVNGFNTEQSWYPDDSLRVVVFTNTARSHPEALEQALAAAVLGVELPPPAAPASAASAPPPTVALPMPAARYVGIYDIKVTNRTLVTHITATPEGLTMQAEGQRAFPLRHIGEGTFAADFDPTLRVSFTFPATGPATMRVAQRGQEFEGPRRP